MARRYWFKDAAGRKQYRASLGAAADAAARLANQIGRRVVVGYDDVKAVVARHNPDPAAFFDMMRQRTLETDKARAVGQRRRAKQLKPAKRQAPATPAAKQAPGKQGAAARRAGMPSGMNPYKPGSMGAHLWRNGWEKAR